MLAFFTGVVVGTIGGMLLMAILASNNQKEEAKELVFKKD